MAQRSHEVDYRIHGDDLQFVEVELDPGETVIGEAGAMMFLESGITFETKMGDGAEPEKGLFGKLKDAGKRALAGESLFITHFTNTGRGKQLVAFSAEFPGKIVPIDLDDMGGEIIAQKDAFLCAALGTKIDIAFRRNLGVGLFGGEGFILQRLQGDGMAFLSVGGTVVEKRLEGDKLLVDTGCLVAMEPGIDYQIERAGNLKSHVLRGRGPVPREPLRTRAGLAAVNALLAAGEPHPGERAEGRRQFSRRRLDPRRSRARAALAGRPREGSPPSQLAADSGLGGACAARRSAHPPAPDCFSLWGAAPPTPPRARCAGEGSRVLAAWVPTRTRTSARCARLATAPIVSLRGVMGPCYPGTLMGLRSNPVGGAEVRPRKFGAPSALSRPAGGGTPSPPP